MSVQRTNTDTTPHPHESCRVYLALRTFLKDSDLVMNKRSVRVQSGEHTYDRLTTVVPRVQLTYL